MPDSFLTPRVGHVSSGQTSVEMGFRPDYVEFNAFRHPVGFNERYDSGDNNGDQNAYGWSYGIASSSASSDQFVQAFSSGSDSVNAHHTYVGDGEIVHVMTPSGDGSGVQGTTVAVVESFDPTGLTLSWPTDYDGVDVIYRAYSTEAVR